MLPKLPLKNYIYAAISLNVVVTLVIIIFKNFLPPIVPILYGRPSGEGQLVPTLGLLIVPAFSMAIAIVNSAVSNYSKNIFLQKILASASLLIAVLSAIAVLKIIFLIGLF